MMPWLVRKLVLAAHSVLLEHRNYEEIKLLFRLSWDLYHKYIVGWKYVATLFITQPNLPHNLPYLSSKIL